jgi:hypothetical protein
MSNSENYEGTMLKVQIKLGPVELWMAMERSLSFNTSHRSTSCVMKKQWLDLINNDLSSCITNKTRMQTYYSTKPMKVWIMINLKSQPHTIHGISCMTTSIKVENISPNPNKHNLKDVMNVCSFLRALLLTIFHICHERLIENLNQHKIMSR